VKINFTQELKDFAGEPIRLTENGANLTLKDVIFIAIRAQLQDDNNSTLDQKLLINKIGEAVHENSELSTEQASALKERVSKVFPSPAVCGAICKAIEG
jgi:hypothetical protein